MPPLGSYLSSTQRFLPPGQTWSHDPTWWVLGEALVPVRHPPPNATGRCTWANLLILEPAPAATWALETLQGLPGS